MKKYETYEEARVAVQQLKPVPTNGNKYRNLYKKDPRLTSTPQKKYKNNGWNNWDEYLGLEKKDHYDNYEEARTAVQQLKPVPTTGLEYQEVYKQDPLLISTPDRKYKDNGWNNWEEYLGQEKKYAYDTYKEAQAAIQQLDPVPTIMNEYMKVYRQDPLLISTPDRKYKNNGWNNWEEYLGKEKKDHYDNYEEARTAVQQLKPVPTTGLEYQEVYKQDPRLISTPQKKYKNNGWNNWEEYLGKEKKDPLLTSTPQKKYKNNGWNNWDEYLGKEKKYAYDTYKEAQAAIQQLDPVPIIMNEYMKVYRQDPLLTSFPDKKYKNNGWNGWEEYLGKEKKDHYDNYEEARTAVQQLKPVPTTGLEYQEVYKQDPRLISTPQKKYKNNGWNNWEEYLGKEKKDHYDTYKEARTAVQQLKPVPTTLNEYRNRYKKDPRLTSTPDTKYKNNGWNNWNEYLGKEKKDLYEAYEEARTAVQQLKPVPTTGPEYQEVYKQDPRLPAMPDAKYKNNGWNNWEEYLGQEKKDHYDTYKEARTAVQQLNPEPTTMNEYRKVISQDPKLPSNPARTYADDWVGTPHYLGVKVATYKELVSWIKINIPNLKTPFEFNKRIKGHAEYVSSYQHAKKGRLEGYYDFVNLVGIEYQDPLEAILLIKKIKPTLSSMEEYSELRQWYCSLPECPITTYGFEDFESFLSFDTSMYFDKNQAIDFCAKHKIESIDDYKKHALKTPQLPLKPSLIKSITKLAQIKYKPSYFDAVFESNGYDEWIELADLHCASGKNAGGRKALIKNFYVYFNKELKASIVEQFRSQTPMIDPTDWFNQLPDSQRNESSLNKVNGFLNFIFEKKFCAVDAESGESVPQEGFRNPVNFKNLPVEFISSKLFQTNKTALPFKYIEKARDFIADDSVTSLGGIYHHIKSRSDYFDNHNEWFEVDESLVDKSDVNCIWKEESSGFSIWSPVKMVATLLQLYMPFRGSQIAWLDSGEADKYKLQLKNGEPTWVENTLLDDCRVPVKRWQGFLKPATFGDKKSLVSCHVNSNKTSKSSALGYDIPWIDERVLPFLVQLRDWQEKYNPINKPKKWVDAHLDKGDAKSELTKFGFNGSSCFLMRDPCNADGKSPIRQGTIGNTLKGILHLIEDDELELTQVKSGAPTGEDGKARALSGIKTIFTLHSMRVSLITAYIVDAKIAPEVVQKLVGHSSIVMTIYYTKIEAETIRDTLRGAEPRIIANQVDRVEQLNRQRKLEELSSELIDGNGKIKKSQLHQEPAGNIFMDHGICPNGQTKCSDATTQGYLGAENCLSCPHYITGPAFLGGLQTIVNEVSLECKAVAIRIEDLREEVDALESEEYQAQKEGRSFTDSHKLSVAQSTYQKEVVRFDSLTVDMIKAIRFSKNALELLNEGGNDNNSTKLIAQKDAQSAHIHLSEVSDYIHFDTICQGAEFFQSSRPELASPQRTQLIDLFARKNGLEPGMFALSAKQQVAIGNQVTNLLLARLGSFEKLSRAMDKDSTITLDELGLSDVKNTRRELTALMKGSTPSIGHTESKDTQVELKW